MVLDRIIAAPLDPAAARTTAHLYTSSFAWTDYVIIMTSLRSIVNNHKMYHFYWDKNEGVDVQHCLELVILMISVLLNHSLSKMGGAFIQVGMLRG